MAHKNLSILHWNCNGIFSKKEMLTDYLQQYKPHICSLNEIKLTELEANKYLRFNGYSSILKCRKQNGNYGGGVALLIREDVSFEECCDFNNTDVEVVAVKINLNKTDLLIMSIYNPPDRHLKSICWEFLANYTGDYLVCGDFNAKARSFGCSKYNDSGRFLEEFLINTNGVLVNTPAHTYFKGDYSELLDLFLCSTNIASKIRKFRAELNQLLVSDHLPIEVWLSIKEFNTRQAFGNARKMDFSKADWVNYRSVLDNIANENRLLLSGQHDIDSLNSFLISSIEYAASTSIPVRIEHKLTALPHHILEKIKKRHQLRQEYNKGANENIKIQINKLNKIIKQDIWDLRTKQWSGFVEKFKGNATSSKPFWNKINEFRGSKRVNLIPPIKQDQNLYKEDIDKAEFFAEKLASTFSNDRAGPAEHEREVAFNLKEYRFASDELDYKPIDRTEIILAMSALNCNSAPGQDNIHNHLLKNLPLSFIDFLVYL
jgi:hypothetical protein